jgi:hypothetical protein
MATPTPTQPIPQQGDTQPSPQQQGQTAPQAPQQGQKPIFRDWASI